jgi:uncharacterized protein with ParB-like and HNH nuclease domain
MKTGRYSLRELLTHNEIEQIIIPEIQRDYVWEISNVAKLIDDINKNYEKKKNHQLEIKINGIIEENDSVNQFLTKEYERLKYHQKLGFIYAYHDRDYAGKFFLIDGQQRLTTLFLILLFLYKELDKTDLFRLLYFNNQIPKVNYKVREQSNDFLKLMIECELRGKSYLESEQFYKTEYLKDMTISHLITNYNHIKSQIGQIKNKEGFLEYLEDFVEVNYFDTHLSEQGEQLYIYMNSRGEQLSFQEIVRAELMQKISDPLKKIILGNEWEKWQNFFWQKRGNINENADKGFEEFLKWAAIIHMGLNNEVELINFAKPYKELKIKELKENYIKVFRSIEAENINNQSEAIFKYQIKYLDFEFLKNLFHALYFIYNNRSQYIPVFDDWLNGKINLIDYVLLLPILQYVAQNDWLDENEKIADIERVTMFLKNVSYFEGVGKNPDTATVDALSIISQLKGTNKSIDNLKDVSSASKTIVTKAEIGKIDHYINSSFKRRNWEEFVWNITLDHEYNSFLMGDTSVLFKCLSLHEAKGFNELESIDQFNNVVRQVVFKNKQSDKLRRLILSNDDSLLYCGSGINGSLVKYSFIGNGNSWENWREWKLTFEKDLFIQLLIWIKNTNQFDLQILLDKAKVDFLFDDWRSTFINYYELLKYCSDKKILWQNNNRILLLEKTNYSIHNSREIQCALLKDSFKDEGMWVHENNCCVLEFGFENNEIQFRNADNKGFVIDIVYAHDSLSWSFTLFHRKHNIVDLIDLSKEQNWIIDKDRLTAKESFLFNFDKDQSLINNNSCLKIEVDMLLIRIKDLFNEAQYE